MRKPVVAGNWKMNGTRESVSALMSELLQESFLSDICAEVDVVVCPPFVYLDQVHGEIVGQPIALGAQNASQQESGAFTGEVSAGMLKDVGVEYVILGHSERRSLYFESDEQVAAKFSAAQAAGLVPILCVGETRAQRESGEAFAVVETQLKAVIERSGAQALQNSVIAYEPVWAIGTGLTASPEQAQEVHAHIRSIIRSFDQDVASGVRIVYGGSVKPSNAGDLFRCEDIDGGLIGGASLVAADFAAICAAAN